jgi:hypothetical protein
MLSNILYCSGILVPISGIQEPGSGENLFRIPDPGVKKAPDPGSATLLPTSLFPPTPEFCIPVLTCPDEDDVDSVYRQACCAFLAGCSSSLSGAGKWKQKKLIFTNVVLAQ